MLKTTKVKKLTNCPTIFLPRILYLALSFFEFKTSISFSEDKIRKKKFKERNKKTFAKIFQFTVITK